MFLYPCLCFRLGLVGEMRLLQFNDVGLFFVCAFLYHRVIDLHPASRIWHKPVALPATTILVSFIMLTQLELHEAFA